MDGQFTKPPPEGDEAISSDLLITKNQELMPCQRLLDGLDLLLCQVSAEVDAGYLGAQGMAEPGDRQASAVDSRWFGKSRVPKIYRGSSLGDTRE